MSKSILGVPSSRVVEVAVIGGLTSVDVLTLVAACAMDSRSSILSLPALSISASMSKVALWSF